MSFVSAARVKNALRLLEMMVKLLQRVLQRKKQGRIWSDKSLYWSASPLFRSLKRLLIWDIRSCRSWNKSSLKHWTKSVLTDLLVASSSGHVAVNLLADPTEPIGEATCGSARMWRSTTPGVRIPGLGDLGDLPPLGDLPAIGDLGRGDCCTSSVLGFVISMEILERIFSIRSSTASEGRLCTGASEAGASETGTATAATATGGAYTCYHITFIKPMNAVSQAVSRYTLPACLKCLGQVVKSTKTTWNAFVPLLALLQSQ